MAIIRFDTKGLSDFLNGLGKRLEKNFDSKKAVSDSARLVASLIKKRTRVGRDVNNKPFTPYKRKSGAPSKVDLDSSGKMLNAIEVRLLGDREAVVGIFDTVQRRKAIVHQLGLGRMPQRKFFGVSGGDAATMSAIKRIFRRELIKATGKV